MLNAPIAHSAQKPLIRVKAVVALVAAKLPTTLNALRLVTVTFLQSLYALIAELSLLK